MSTTSAELMAPNEGKQVELTRRYRFSASHRLHASSLSERENDQVYGKCNNPFGHGHDYVLDVTVRGAVEERTGMLTPIARLDAYVLRNIVRRYDHRYLNQELPEFAEMIPTAENIARAIQTRLREGWGAEFGASPTLARIRIEETRRNIVELD